MGRNRTRRDMMGWESKSWGRIGRFRIGRNRMGRDRMRRNRMDGIGWVGIEREGI